MREDEGVSGVNAWREGKEEMVAREKRSRERDIVGSRALSRS